MLVSADHDLVSFARSYRDYGKPDYAQPGLNLRMNEFTAALGLVGTERLDEIAAWKNAAAREWLDPEHPNRVELPPGMVSGLYKYIVFDPIARSTGKSTTCRAIASWAQSVDLPNSDWVAANHWCVPLYYQASPEGAEEGTDV